MVQLMKSGNLCLELENKPDVCDKVPVKLEIEDPLEEEHGPLNKRCRPSMDSQEQRSASTDTSNNHPSQYNILDEPSPLGLRLRKSPSLLDLIQMKLAQGSTTPANTQNKNLSSGVKGESRVANTSCAGDKLKASNFPASLLRIGSWEYKSKYEGDLVAKCYFAKHKLVWEVLEGGLKSKIEIQWSDIMALNANFPDNGPSTLSVVLARQPLFFRETNPQPRKHTLWQATADFTDGQASKYRQHFLQCPQGLLNKHFEKLIQCDARLNFLSQQPAIILDSPYFDTRPAAFVEPDESKDHCLNQVNDKVTVSSCVQGIGSPHASQSSSFNIEISDPSCITLDSRSREVPSPSSGSGCSETESKDPRNWDQIKVPGLRPSMSDPAAAQNPHNTEGFTAVEPDENPNLNHNIELMQDNKNRTDAKVAEEDTKDVSGGKQAPGMSRKDSFGDLLLHLPRIASLPKFLFNISEEDSDCSQGR
ncbi:uncharacterized protein LOC114733503 isoform X2 [Neltuma alba]|uniref:uncharacterized protein LOC114733503 isoform X2 n=1 Tax=Neltuma alba TaxID=207710 RepID=UPI0010A338A4|nr:uncharacterized protein LOC114733503 isoform X2 [Prosopis alba]